MSHDDAQLPPIGSDPGPAGTGVAQSDVRPFCRILDLRRCPPGYGADGCGLRHCARLESDDEEPWLVECGRSISGGPLPLCGTCARWGTGCLFAPGA